MGRGGLFGVAGLALFSVIKALNRPFCKYVSLRMSKFGSSPTEVPSPCAIHLQVLMSEEFPAPLAPTKPLQTRRKKRLGLGKGRGLGTLCHPRACLGLKTECVFDPRNFFLCC